MHLWDLFKLNLLLVSVQSFYVNARFFIHCRLEFWNLKVNDEANALSTEDEEQIWIPTLVFRDRETDSHLSNLYNLIFYNIWFYENGLIFDYVFDQLSWFLFSWLVGRVLTSYFLKPWSITEKVAWWICHEFHCLLGEFNLEFLKHSAVR